MRRDTRGPWILSGVAALFLTTAFTLAGCDNKEEVLDIETPNGEVEVEQDQDTGAIDVEVDE